MTEFYIVRHGKTEFNKEKKLQGHLDSPLLERSVEDIKKIAEKLSDVGFDVIISSDLGRAVETAKIVKKELAKKEINKNIKLKAAKELREIDFGDLDGKKIPHVLKEYLKLKTNIHHKAPNGESYKQLYDRVIKHIKRLEGKYEKVLIVTHSGCIRALYSFFSNKSYKAKVMMPMSNNIIMYAKLGKGRPKGFELIQK